MTPWLQWQNISSSWQTKIIKNRSHWSLILCSLCCAHFITSCFLLSTNNSGKVKNASQIVKKTPKRKRTKGEFTRTNNYITFQSTDTTDSQHHVLHFLPFVHSKRSSRLFHRHFVSWQITSSFHLLLLLYQ